VASVATGAWAGKDGKIALYIYDAWYFITPLSGWRAWVADAAHEVTHDGTDWVAGLMALGTTGARTRHSISEVVHTVTAGADNTTALIIPDRASLLCVSGRVTGAITGALATFSVGIAGQATKFSSGLATTLDSNFTGPAGFETFWTDTPVKIFGEGGDLAGGEITLAAHYTHYSAPSGA